MAARPTRNRDPPARFRDDSDDSNIRDKRIRGSTPQKRTRYNTEHHRNCRSNMSNEQRAAESQARARRRQNAATRAAEALQEAADLYAANPESLLPPPAVLLE
jgi:hypothetical protein